MTTLAKRSEYLPFSLPALGEEEIGDVVDAPRAGC